MTTENGCIMQTQNGSEIALTWPEDQREVAQAVISRYGEPDEVTPTRLIWRRREPWKEIVVAKDGTPHNFPFPHLDIVETSVSFPVPPEKECDLARFDGSLTVRRTQGLLSSRCHDEQANILTLNLAHDVIVGSKTAEEARKAYVEAMIDFRAKGHTPYMDSLLFEPDESGVDPDTALLTSEELRKTASLRR